MDKKPLFTPDKITKKQNSFIHTWIGLQNKLATTPTYQEMADALSFRSSNAVGTYYTLLIKKGVFVKTDKISKLRSKSRSIALTSDAAKYFKVNVPSGVNTGYSMQEVLLINQFKKLNSASKKMITELIDEMNSNDS